ncbi:MAG: nuclease-related domain-containing protein, partial [Marmoricola sp.]
MLHDVAVPGDVEVPIDHVLAGPSGVYVINTISGSGALRMDENSLLVAGTSQYAHIEDVAAAALALRGAIGGRPVVPILCFQRSDEVAGVVSKVAVCSTENILELLNGQPSVLGAAAVNDVMRLLNSTLLRQTAARETLTIADGTTEAKPRHRDKAKGRKRLLGFGRSGADEGPVDLSVVAPMLDSEVEVDPVQAEVERLEAERLAAEAERVAKQEAARLEVERVAQEKAAQVEAERVEAKRLELMEVARAEAEKAERQAAAEAAEAAEVARLEAERIAAAEAARVEAERVVADEAARVEAERVAAEEAARVEAERLAAAEAARVEAEKVAAAEAARVQAERLEAEEAARVEAEQAAAEEAARVEAARVEAER